MSVSKKKSLDVHISSLVIQLKPEYVSLVTESIRQLEFAELHIVSPEGKLVVIMETPSRYEVTNTIETIGSFQGVLNVTMVYHHVEQLDAMDDIVNPSLPVEQSKVERIL